MWKFRECIKIPNQVQGSVEKILKMFMFSLRTSQAGIGESSTKFAHTIRLNTF